VGCVKYGPQSDRLELCYRALYGRALFSPHPHLWAPIGDKPRFGDKQCKKARYFEGFGRGGGDRTHDLRD